ncbi:MAG: hypothetical protein EPN82_10025 [Bacteroidetes bacterium]|nr:MAG: hypothetical protein EPN82_10025 [Bacteroidota bacterium]
MDYEDNLVQFIDGELPEDRERELFSMISADDSLRAEYKSLLGINNAIKSSAAYYSPSSELKAAVYRDLNISIPVKHVPAFAKFIQGTKLNLLSCGIGAVLASTVFFVSTNFLSQGAKSDLATQIPIPPLQNSETQSNSNMKNNSLSYNKQIIKTKFQPKINNSVNESLPINNNNSIIAISELIIPENGNIIYDVNDKSKIIDISDLTKNLNDLTEIQKEDNASNEKIGISVEARWSTNWSLARETVKPSKISDFNNLGFDMFFSIVDNFDFGINIRQETFFVKYEEKISNNLKYKLEQNPNLTSYGISIRKRYPINDDLQPFGQMNLAINKYGIILRPSIGITYNFYNDFSLVETFEYSNMFFTHNQEWFSASKIGLNFGINYKF